MITIYALRNRVNGFAYVGSTKGNIAKRMREHRCLLNSGQHKCAKLLDDWREFGEASFELDTLSRYDWTLQARREAELFWMGYFARDGRLYNEHHISMQPTTEAIEKGVRNAHNSPGNRWTPEANAKRSIAQLGIPKGHGAKISATKRAKRIASDEIVSSASNKEDAGIG